jgi:hypothetical protein
MESPYLAYDPKTDQKPTSKPTNYHFHTFDVPNGSLLAIFLNLNFHGFIFSPTTLD